MRHLIIFIVFLISMDAVSQKLQNSSVNRAQVETGCGVNNENSKLYLKIIGDNINRLRQQNTVVNPTTNKSNAASFATPSVKLQWPLRPVDDANFSYYRISNYVDLDPNAIVYDADSNYVSGLRDYNCGTRTYDGHNGLDIVVEPYIWRMMDNEKVSVIAAATGIIVGGDDGNYDANCTTNGFTGPTWGNWLGLMHPDSTVTVYLHMKENSVIPVVIGQTITAGTHLGFVGSAGRSTAPHLHFGVYINNTFLSSGTWDQGTLVEPFNGSCQTSNASFWQIQKPYNEPAVIAIETHNNMPQTYDSNCDKTVNLYYDKSFSGGSVVYTRTWFRDWVDGSQAFIQFINPNGTIVKTAIRTNSNNRRITNADEALLLSTNPVVGTWTVNVLFNGTNHQKYFTVGCVNNYTLSGALSGNKGYIAGNAITSTQTISAASTNIIKYGADSEVQFLPGFEAKAGSHITANTKGCVNGNQ